jgi:hypothetical protein
METVSPSLHVTIWIDCFVDILLLIDIILRCAYFSYHNGTHMETRYVHIAKHYFSDTFLYDVLGTFLFDYFILMNSDYIWLLYWLRIFRLVRLHRITEYINLAENFVQNHIIKNAVYIHMIQQFFVIAVTKMNNIFQL